MKAHRSLTRRENRRCPVCVGCAISIRRAAAAQAALRVGGIANPRKSALKISAPRATLRYVCSALWPAIPKVSLRAREWQVLADSCDSPLLLKAALGDSGAFREGQLTGLVANSRNRPPAAVGSGRLSGAYLYLAALQFASRSACSV